MIRLFNLSFRLPILGALLLTILTLPASGQTLADYGEFYRTMNINALERFVFCYPTTTPEREPAAIGVRRDTLGRPVEVTRFFFGNPDNKGELTTITISYRRLDSNGAWMEQRSFIGPGGFPVAIGFAYGEEVFFRADGTPSRRRSFDIQGRPLEEVPAVTRSMYRVESPGVIYQEWFYGPGKQHYGTGTDGSLRRFGPVSEGAYFRRYEVDDKGNIVYEELETLYKQPRAFPGGEYRRVYENDDCGQPLSITYLDAKGRPMANSMGIARETFSYDDHGRLLEWRFVGVDGDPHGRQPDGAAAVVFTWRAHDGALLRQERYDAKGNVIEEKPQ